MDNVILTQTTKESLVNEIALVVIAAVEELLSKQKKENLHEKEWLTRKEVSQLFKVSLVTISEWSKPSVGILKPYRIGSRIRFKKDEVLAALAAIETKNG